MIIKWMLANVKILLQKLKNSTPAQCNLLQLERKDMFYTIEELVQQADNFSGNVAELMIATEIELTGRSREEILTIMSRNLTVMKDSIVDGLTESKSVSGLTGGDAAKLDAYMKSGKTLSDSAVLSAEMPWPLMN